MTNEASEPEQSAPATPAQDASPRPEGGRTEERTGGGARPGRGGGGRRGFSRRKVCAFCVDKITHIDYKDAGRLRRYVTDRGKIEPRRKTGTCAKHQRAVTLAIKRARHVALLPFSASHARAIPGAPTSYRDRQERQLTENAQRADSAAAEPATEATPSASDASALPEASATVPDTASDTASDVPAEAPEASANGEAPAGEPAPADASA